LNSLLCTALEEAHRQSRRWWGHDHRLLTAEVTLVRGRHLAGSAGGRLVPEPATAAQSATDQWQGDDLG